jgi:sigma-E factor negative regulatory protein RseB
VAEWLSNEWVPNLTTGLQSAVLGSLISLGAGGLGAAGHGVAGMAAAGIGVISLSAAGLSYAAGESAAPGGTPSTIGPDDTEVEPAELVKAMSVALKTLNYEGTFVHMQGTHITSMHILHSSTADGELERLVALDGEAREVVRNHALVTCIWPDSQSVVVSKSKPRELLPPVDTDLATNKRYRFSLGKPDRVAGLPTFVVNVVPTDTHRYGYRFWIDRETHMLLRSMLLDGPHKAVEQVMFTHIEYPVSIDLSRFDVSPNDEQLSWLEPRKASATSGLPDILADQVDRVGFTDLPQGYREVSETYSPMPLNDDGPVSHVMLTDGMASVSVYVEYIDRSEQDQASAGLSSMGAMNAFGLSTDNAFITAVGEVPPETVRAIAEAVMIR